MGVPVLVDAEDHPGKPYQLLDLVVLVGDLD